MLFGLHARAQLLVLVLGPLRLAVDGVLQALQRRLEVLDARLEHLDPMLPTAWPAIALHLRSPQGRADSMHPRYSLCPPVPIGVASARQTQSPTLT